MGRLKVIFLLLVFCVSGCSSMQTAIEFSELELVANTRRPVFLRDEASSNLFLTVDCPIHEWTSLPPTLARELEQKGYTIVSSRNDADIIMAVQLRRGDVEKHSARAVQGRQDATASTSALGGGALGYLVSSGDPVSAIASGLGGLAVGGVADITINSWVYLGILEVNGDILVVERLKGAKGEWWASTLPDAAKETETAVTVRAKQSGLKWEEVASPIADKLQGQLASVLPARKP